MGRLIVECSRNTLPFPIRIIPFDFSVIFSASSPIHAYGPIMLFIPISRLSQFTTAVSCTKLPFIDLYPLASDNKPSVSFLKIVVRLKSLCHSVKATGSII